LIRHYVEHGKAELFERVIRQAGRGLTSKVRLDENPFHYGLLAMFVDDTILTRHDRSLFAHQMLYAYRHQVPPELLIGFIYQCGSSSELRRKVKAGVVEAGFEAVYRTDLPPQV
jgi:hypothetical protein